MTYQGKPEACTFVGAADALHTRAANQMGLVVVAKVGRDSFWEQLRRQPLPSLECLVDKCAQLHAMSSKMGLSILVYDEA